MSGVQSSDFATFFRDLHNRRPFPWQERLADRVCTAGWPAVIDLPTASGKTACIDIALFALAVRGGDAPRRIFFVVDRRVIVSEAFDRAKRIAASLEEPKTEMLARVADELRGLARGEKPLGAYELRGGAYRDETWVESPLQPLVIASTVDQVGSRLLFRGYGVSQNSWPLHAGLVAHDALIFLDEAHCSRAFAQTLDAVRCYRGRPWEKSTGRAFHFVEMTATPVLSEDEHERFQITDEDRKPDFLGERIYAEKPTRLAVEKCRKEDSQRFAGVLAEEAVRQAEQAGAKRIAVMVNRVRTAKLVHEQLQKQGLEALLVIGRMRPIDRDRMEDEWKALKSGVARAGEDPLRFVVSTQCLEVGADLDFDVLVSECASIDALRQRFGRLDRLGQFGRARGSIVVASWQLTAREGDPVYGTALRETWNWLEKIGSAGEVNMGIESKNGSHRTVSEQWHGLSVEEKRQMQMEGKDAPVLLPAHLDALVQTSPTPEPEPLVELFLHGPEHGAPDVQVVWRADLHVPSSDKWSEIVALCPPSSMEAMPVPISAFRRWLTGEASTEDSDVEIVARTNGEGERSERKRLALLWRGPEKSKALETAGEIRPGDTLVLPISKKAWQVFGFIPDDFQKDIGDAARFKLKRGICLRLQPQVLDEWPESEKREELKRVVMREDVEKEQIIELLDEMVSNGRVPEWFPKLLDELRDSSTLSRYPDERGYVLERRVRRQQSRSGKEVFLEEHLDDVREETEHVAGGLIDAGETEALVTAARFHDYGKADARYQTWLRGGDALAAEYAPKPLAKSGKTLTRRQTECGLPEEFRHEVLSLLFAAKSSSVRAETRDLTLHLIASHHGRCRPFAPATVDEEATRVTFDGISVCRQDRVGEARGALGIEIADRFWRLTRQYGWWGLAYLEGLLRLADWKASDGRSAEVSK